MIKIFLTKLLIKRFARQDKIKNGKGQSARYAYGRLAGIVGIAVNIILVAIKFVAGGLSGSVSIVADGVNNLSDAASSIVTLVGFKLASAPPDEEHPYGHGRIEYIAGLFISIIIILAGVELLKSSVGKIINPVKTNFSVITFVVLALSILMKLWLYFFNRKLGKEIKSKTLLATAADSRNDVICTLAILVTALVSYFTKLELDGYVGVLVAGFVVFSGIEIIKDTISPLIGSAPSKDLIDEIKSTVLSKEDIIGTHDVVVHNYGPEKRYISLHAEVSSAADIIDSHDLVDEIERELAEKYSAVVCIHMDPVDVDDERVVRLKEKFVDIVNEVDPEMSFHDFRVVFGEKRISVWFDLVIPFERSLDALYSSTEIRGDIQKKAWDYDRRIIVIANIEHPFG